MAFMLTQKDKEKIIEKFKTHEGDTGSPSVQIAILSEEIKRLLGHLKKYPKDLHSKKGLLKMVVKRKKLLSYLKKENEELHAEVLKKVGLKR
jgi:small subunit ribosomal protein S15